MSSWATLLPPLGGYLTCISLGPSVGQSQSSLCGATSLLLFGAFHSSPDASALHSTWSAVIYEYFWSPQRRATVILNAQFVSGVLLELSDSVSGTTSWTSLLLYCESLGLTLPARSYQSICRGW
jgi:hypothetical protein